MTFGFVTYGRFLFCCHSFVGRNPGFPFVCHSDNGGICLDKNRSRSFLRQDDKGWILTRNQIYLSFRKPRNQYKKKLCKESVNLIAFLTFLTTIWAFFNILGDDIGFEEKNRILYMLSRGSQPRYQMTNFQMQTTLVYMLDSRLLQRSLLQLLLLPNSIVR